jgi:predicted DNA-binding transcriptional regulator YafY
LTLSKYPLLFRCDKRRYNLWLGNMRKSERLLYILSLLRSNKRLRAKELARKCVVTERTIYRDIISISCSNIPIYFDDGYKLLPQDSVAPNSFSSAEADFLISLLKNPLLPYSQPESQIVEQIINKIQASGIQKEDLSNLIPEMNIVFDKIPPKPVIIVVG